MRQSADRAIGRSAFEHFGAVIASGAKQSRPGSKLLQCGSPEESSVKTGDIYEARAPWIASLRSQ